jgi:polar amino acid transport system substrate-binding protein
MKLLFVLTLSAILASSTATAKAKEQIVFGVNIDYAMPLVQMKDQAGTNILIGGILKDLGEALAKEMDLDIKWYLVPKRRVAPNLSSGKIDILCHLAEVWQPGIKNDVWWSNKLYRSANVLVYLKEQPISSLKEIYGEPVGVVLNFIYKGLDPSFESGTLKREDGPNNIANIKKLLKGRINYIVMSNLEFAYYHNLYPPLRSVDLAMDEVTTKCAVSKKSKLKIEDVNKAIAKITRTGTLSKILNSYYFKSVD